jgi:hypothetical protein
VVKTQRHHGPQPGGRAGAPTRAVHLRRLAILREGSPPVFLGVAFVLGLVDDRDLHGVGAVPRAEGAFLVSEDLAAVVVRAVLHSLDAVDLGLDDVVVSAPAEDERRRGTGNWSSGAAISLRPSRSCGGSGLLPD